MQNQFWNKKKNNRAPFHDNSLLQSDWFFLNMWDAYYWRYHTFDTIEYLASIPAKNT